MRSSKKNLEITARKVGRKSGDYILTSQEKAVFKKRDCIRQMLLRTILPIGFGKMEIIGDFDKSNYKGHKLIGAGRREQGC